MKTNFLKLLALMCVIGLFIIPSCKDKDDDDDTTLDTDTQSAIDNSFAEDAVSQAFSTVNQYGLNEAGIKSSTQKCVTITVTPAWPDTTFPKTMEINFGTGCADHNGVIRKGIINAVFYLQSGHWHNATPGDSVTIEFDNYYVSDIKREGTITVTVNNPNPGPSHTVVAENCKLIFTNEDVVSWNAERTVDWIEGFTTICPEDSCIEDDAFRFSGNSNGVNRNNLAYTVEITTPLIKAMNCKWFSEGVFNLTPAGHATRTVDFGDGTCDNKATVTIAGITINIEL